MVLVLSSCATFGLEKAFDKPIQMGLSLINFYLNNNLEDEKKEERDMG